MAQARTYENPSLAAMTRQVEAQIAQETAATGRPSLELLREGRALMAGSRPREALARFAEAIQVNPTSYTLWVVLRARGDRGSLRELERGAGR